MTRRGDRDDKKGDSINHLNLNHYDKEGNSKIRDSAYRIDCIGDTDCTGRHIVRRRVERRNPQAIKSGGPAGGFRLRSAFFFAK